MLPKKIRATKALMDKAFKEGRRVSSPAFDLVYTKTNTPYSVFGVSPTKKSAKNSVERHYLRRFCYDSIPLKKIKKVFLYIVLVKSQLSKDKNKNRESIEKLFKDFI